MGFVDDSDPENSSSTSLRLTTDEESVQPTTSNGRLPSSLLNTPTTRSNDFYGSTTTCRKSVTETDEILEELEDDTLPSLFSPAFSHHRRASAKSTPSKRIGKVRDDGWEADERTSLLARTGTGRSYKDRRRRRRSEPSVGGSRRRQASGDSSQEWWKMRWWRGSEGKRKDDDENGNDGEARD